MKAIVVFPVWAWAIVHGHKPVENRSWHTQHRGPLLIQASRERDDSREGDARARKMLAALGVTVPDEVPSGAIVGMVNLDDSCEVPAASPDADKRLSHPLATGKVCFLLSRPVVFRKPVPMRGQQKIFDVDAAVVRSALAELGITSTEY